MTRPVPELIDRLDALTEPELLALHREVCRRAARIYGVRHKNVRDANFRAAMAHRDTRFQRGLTVHENITRCHRFGPEPAREPAGARLAPRNATAPQV